MRVPSEYFSVLTEESNGTSHLFLTGWLDASAVPALMHAITRVRPCDVVLDIDGLELIDGAGWLGVISCAQRVANWGGRLLIDDGIRKILELDPADR
jgi:anti-anti-sigma regulatory factor